MTLGQNICRLRTERGLSQGDLADALDVSRQSISKWETDASIPELEKLLRLSELFHITLDELVKGPGGSVETPPPAPEPSAAKEDAPWQPEAQLLQTLDRQMNRTVGWVLLGFGALLTLLLAMLGDGLAGLLLASPLFLCGVICLTAKRRAGLWCAWACGLLGLVWLLFRKVISWHIPVSYIATVAVLTLIFPRGGADAVGHSADAALVQPQAVQHHGGNVPLRVRHVLRVGGQNGGGALLQRIGHRQQQSVFLLRRRGAQRRPRGLCLLQKLDSGHTAPPACRRWR